MADNLIFPIGFDLEKGVKDVISRSDTYLRQIEHAMNRKPIVLRAEVDASKFQMFSRQFTNSIYGISAKLAQAQRLWNAMTFDVKFDADGNLSRRAQVVFDAFQQLTQASATMGQRLREVNRNLAKSEQDTARAITAEYDKRRQQVNEQIRLKERQAAAEERVRQGQLKGVNVGYVDTQRQVEAVRNLRLQYEAILPMLNAMAQRRYDIKVGIDKQFEADIQRINADIARLCQLNLQLGAKGDTNGIQANLQAIRQLEAELQRISQQKIDLLNNDKINSDLARLRTEVSSVFGELQSAERRLASDNSLNAALDAQSQKVLKLHADIQKLDQQFAQLNATGKVYNQDGSFTAQANTLLQQRIALTKQLEQEAITGQQAQIKLEQQLREEKRQTEQAAKNAAKEAERQAKAEAERQAKAEAAARKQAQDTANAKNKARQEAYNARRRQGLETQRILNNEAKSIADITAKLQIQQQRLQSADIGSAKFNKIAKEVRRLTADLEKANQKMRELTGQTQSGATRQGAAVRKVSQEFNNLNTYVSWVIKRMAVYSSFSYIRNFLASIREVTAQFELQRISLGAIIQDQQRANLLFEKIKTFALKSPVKILDLTKYTKQLAAYKIGVDELFDTTKRLTDISVGLGVSMDRIVLLYGQIRATGYLRASEVRQATEAGIPLVEELAKKLSEANGEMVRASDVMDMISKRKISFELVKEVFEDMTNAGGIFYNMQEKQGNTLYGMWQKLGDAAAMMYDEIGNTSWINAGMVKIINVLRSLMVEWKLAGTHIATLGVAILLYANRVKLAALATKLNTVANTEGLTVLRLRILHLRKAIMEQTLFTTSTTIATTTTKLFTLAQLRLTQVLNLVVIGFRKLSAALMSNIWGIALVALSLLIEHLILAKDQAAELKNELANINLDYEIKQGQDATNLEYLANAAVNAAKGSKAQKDALEELKNTYGKIIPMELLTIENLERMKGNYAELIALIDEYNLKQKYDRETSAIENSFAPKEEERSNKIRNILREGVEISYLDEKTGEESGKILKLSERNIQNFLIDLRNYADEGLDKKEQIIRASADLAAEMGLSKTQATALKNSMITLDRHALEGQGTLMDYTEGLQRKHEAMEVVTEDYERQKKALNGYSEIVDEVLKKNENEPEVTTNKSEVENEKERLNNQISDVASGIVELMNKANITVDSGTQQILTTVIKNGGTISDAVWDALEKAAAAANNPQLLTSIQNLRNHYKELAPDNETVNFVNNGFIKIVSAAQGQMSNYRQYLYDGKTTIKEYQDSLQKSIASLKNQAFEMIRVNALIDAGLVEGQKYDAATIKAVQEKADILQTALDKYVTPLVRPDDKESKTRGNSKSDPRLQTLQEIANKMAEVNKEYDGLLKKEGQTKALADTQKLFASSFKQMRATAKKYKFKLPAFEVPQTIEDVQKWYKVIMDNIKRLKLKNADKVLIELGFKSDKAAIDKQQKDIEAELKRLADRISRSKTAQEFYQKILNLTGDIELAANVSLQIYGSTGRDLKEQVKEQFAKAFKGLESDHADIMPKVDEIINRGAYEELRDYIKLLPESQQKAAEDLVKNQQQMSAKQYEQWLKDLEKAKDYADKRIELSRYTANQITAIEERIARLNPDSADYANQKKMLEGMIADYKAREDKEAAKIEYDMFKDMPIYVQMFDNLDNASTTMLTNMKRLLERNKDKWGEFFDPTQLKEMQSRMNEIDKQLAARNPFKTLGNSLKSWWKLRKSGHTRKGDEEAATEAMEAEAKAWEKWIAANKAYQDALKKHDNDTTNTEVQDAKAVADAANEEYEAAKKTSEKTQKQAKTWQDIADNEDNANDEIDKYQEAVNKALDAIFSMMEALGVDAVDMEFFNSIKEGFNQILDGAQAAATAFSKFAEHNYFDGAMNSVSAITSIVMGISNLFTAGKVRKADKEIERQQELLDQLEYTYSRLEKAADKAFGRDYVDNYNQRLQKLQAQAQAYQKQYEAEKSKGKKADEEAMEEFKNSYRDTMDEIADMQDELVEHFTGSSKTDIARQMAQSWIDARASMSDTFAAIKGDYSDMIKNMIVEGAAARVIENALTPMWNQMDAMLQDNNVDGAIDTLINGMDSALNAANNGMEVLWKSLEAKGYDLKKLLGDTDDSEYSGIAKNISSATSEEINNVAAIGNTLMYYVSPIPRIDENLARILAIMQGGGASTGATASSAGWTDWQQQAMDNYNAIARNTADTVVECRRAADACERIASTFKVKGSTKGLNVFLNS